MSAEHHAGELGERDKALAQAAGAAGAHGPAIGLDQDWAARVLAAVGTYADVYDRNLGPATGLAVPRGLNELFTRGGLQYAVPLH